MMGTTAISYKKFWKIIDYSSIVSGGIINLQEQLLISSLTNFTPGKIIGFEIALRQAIDEAGHYNLMAAQKLIQGWVRDDSNLYFRCWLIAKGRKIFYAALQNPDTLADIVTDPGETSFEQLLYVATAAYKIKTGNEKEDDSFPRTVAINTGDFLDYDMGGSGIKGEEWKVEDLPELYPKLCARFPLVPDATEKPVAALKVLLSKMNIDVDFPEDPKEALKMALELLKTFEDKNTGNHL